VSVVGAYQGIAQTLSVQPGKRFYRGAIFPYRRFISFGHLSFEDHGSGLT
jgi:hypothetical protein